MLKFAILSLFSMLIIAKRNRNSTEWADPQEFESSLNNSRNIFYSCIICSYSFFVSNDLGDLLNNIMDAYIDQDAPEQTIQNQGNIWKRIQLDGVKHCANQQTVEGSKQMYEEIQLPNFNVTKYFYLMNGFNISRYENKNANLEFDKSEETLWTMMQDFHEKLREESGMDENYFMQQLEDQDYYNPQVHILGSPVQEDASSYAIFCIIIGLFFALMLVAYKVLSNSEEVPQKRQKKQKKKE